MTESIYPVLPVMLVDDEVQALDSFEIALRSAGMNHFIRCQDSRDVMRMLSGGEIEVMLLDLRMPYVSGEELLPLINSDFPEVPVIIITGANDVETAVKCMKHGAFDYMVKSRLVGGVRRAVELRELQRENRMLKAHVLSDKLENPEAFSEIVTNSATMRPIFQYIEAISSSVRPVLITGETGVGKELVAKAVHTLSNRNGPFVPVNVAGFLDEIGDLSTTSQVKLLRLLQDGDFYPLGSDVAKGSNARIIVATNQDLDVLRSTGKFRKDLYYRLCDHHIHIPTLAERLEDLPILVEHFLEKASNALCKKKPTPPDELPILLSTYHFPGNIRELESMVFNAVSSHKSGKLSMETFKSNIFQMHPTFETESKQLLQEKSVLIAFHEQLPTLKQAEQLLIDEAMKRANGNQSIASLSLGITRQALNRRLKLNRR
ncbi:MAG: sigma-54-dependent Fis family transcriptional regulator [Deltaproteobacteria bacterium]|nr:sigma-54-dependent Fis family transcriptional regulator [Deltaproteobacteria bacterium]